MGFSSYFYFFCIFCIAGVFHGRMYYMDDHKNDKVVCVLERDTHIHNTREEETSRNVEPIYLIQKLRKMKKSNRFTLLLSFYYLS